MDIPNDQWMWELWRRSQDTPGLEEWKVKAENVAEWTHSDYQTAGDEQGQSDG